MAAKKCPKCNDANDFFINESFQVCCGYCGFVVAKVKDQFTQAKTDCKTKEANAKARRQQNKTKVGQ
ncbi:TPA: hypothetical protein ACQYBV_000588 [Vibrio parahaemolyticus]